MADAVGERAFRHRAGLAGQRLCARQRLREIPLPAEGRLHVLRKRIMRAANWVWLPIAAISSPALATTYFTVEQAQHAIFPGATFTAAGEPNVWRTSHGGLFVVNR